MISVISSSSDTLRLPIIEYVLLLVFNTINLVQDCSP